jgi:hypothetical protein
MLAAGPLSDIFRWEQIGGPVVRFFQHGLVVRAIRMAFVSASCMSLSHRLMFISACRSNRRASGCAEPACRASLRPIHRVFLITE